VALRSQTARDTAALIVSTLSGQLISYGISALPVVMPTIATSREGLLSVEVAMAVGRSRFYASLPLNRTTLVRPLPEDWRNLSGYGNMFSPMSPEIAQILDNEGGWPVYYAVMAIYADIRQLRAQGASLNVLKAHWAQQRMLISTSSVQCSCYCASYFGRRSEHCGARWNTSLVAVASRGDQQRIRHELTT